MMNVREDIHSLSDFKRRTPSFLKRLKASGRPVVLTINGKAELVVFDTASYQRLAEHIDRAEAVAAIKEGLASMKRGESIAAEGVVAAVRKRYGFKKPV